MDLVGRVKKNESRLKTVEADMKKSVCLGSGSVTPGSTPTRKRIVPDEVRVS